jgi:hypothetical protein
MQKRYRPRAGWLRMVLAIAALLGVGYGFWTGHFATWRNWVQAGIEGAAAIAMVGILIHLALRARNEEVLLDEQGLTYRSALGGARTFPWDQVTAYASRGGFFTRQYRVYWGDRFLQFEGQAIERIDDLWSEVRARAHRAREIDWLEPRWWVLPLGPWGTLVAVAALAMIAYLLALALTLVITALGGNLG